MHSRKNFFKKTKIKDTYSLVHLKGLWNTKEISSNYVYKEFSYIENHWLNSIEILNTIKTPIRWLHIDSKVISDKLLHDQLVVDEIHQKNVRSFTINFCENYEDFKESYFDWVNKLKQYFPSIESMSYTIENVK